MKNNYSLVTELPNYPASREQLKRFYTRYRFARDYCEGKEVLEVACGGGQGLGYLAQKAKRVVGGDIDEEVLKYPKDYYKSRENIEILSLDATCLPFPADSFDVIIFYEAIYYLKNPELFLKEAYRVLKSGGALIIGTVNKDWSDFNPSPFSYRYFSIPELFNLLVNQNFKDIKFFGDSPVLVKSFRDKMVSLIKRLAVRGHLIPKSMKGKALFKRIFFGKLSVLPHEISDNVAEYLPPVLIDNYQVNTSYKVFFAVAYK